jgi:NADH-quinone oxidoreductase subunit J
MADKLFYFLTFLALLSALMVVFSRNPVHSVLYLILTFFSLSGHYILLNAQFIAAVNIIVYAGAIMVLFLFVIMFLNMKEDDTNSRSNVLKIAASISGGMLLVVMVAILKDANIAPVDEANFNSQIGMVQNLGQVLFKKYLVPFELASILLLVAMAGAVMLGKREVGERNSF